MRRPFIDHGKRSRSGLSCYQRIKIMNEQKHAWLVMKYQFSCDAEFRVPIYLVRRERAYRGYFRMKLSGRAVEETFQFHRVFRGKRAFKMSTFHPQFGLVDSSLADIVSE